jgi:EpsD family peptidyl-prolyl cis-trans isomerase
MTSPLSLRHVQPNARATRLVGSVAAACLLTLAATGCGNKEANASNKSPSQVAAKVNKEEISVHQINFVLQRTGGVTPETADAASRQILDRLILQELAVQQAQELKLDRSPAVVQAMEAARRDVLARAYTDRIGDGVTKPTPAEVAEFYSKRPQLFKDRKVYSLVEANVQSDAAQSATVRQQLQAARNPQAFAEWLKGSGLKHNLSQGNQPAENLPLEHLPKLAALADGQSLALDVPGGLKIIMVLQSQRASVDEATAKPAIEQFILNERKRAKIDADMKALRASAKVELVGKFAEAPSGALVAAPAASPAPTGAPGTADADTIKKGLGLK